MKYLKQFELFDRDKTISEPKIGDYVICEEYLDQSDDEEYVIAKNFVETHVGLYIKHDTEYDMPLVQYENIPDNIIDFFDSDNVLENCRRMNTDEIKYWSKNKEELEILLVQNKYNL